MQQMQKTKWPIYILRSLQQEVGGTPRSSMEEQYSSTRTVDAWRSSKE